MIRRQFLALGGTTLIGALAGCVGEDGGEVGDQPSPTPTPTPTPLPYDATLGPSVTPEDDEFPMELHDWKRGGGAYALVVVAPADEEQVNCSDRESVGLGWYYFMDETLDDVSLVLENPLDEEALVLEVELSEDANHTEEEIVAKTPPTIIAVDEDDEAELCRTAGYVAFVE